MMEWLDVYMQRLWEVVPPDAEWEEIAGGFRFTEGPVWMEDESTLYFTDIPEATIFRWHAHDYSVDVFRRSSRKSNGLTHDPRGFLLACEHSGRRVVALDRQGRVVEAIEHVGGHRFNSPNDVMVDRTGQVWFTDPTYGIRGSTEGHPGQSDIGFQGVYRWDRDRGEVSLVSRAFAQPNGLALTPDGGTVLVSDSERYVIRRIRRQGDQWEDAGIWMQFNPHDGEGPPDGIRIDAQERVWAAGPGGIWVIGSDGQPWGRIRTPQVVANGCIADGYVYATATTSVYRFALPPRVHIG